MIIERDALLIPCIHCNEKDLDTFWHCERINRVSIFYLAQYIFNSTLCSWINNESVAMTIQMSTFFHYYLLFGQKNDAVKI